jgi:putative thiamine transport system ATP-binding protein
MTLFLENVEVTQHGQRLFRPVTLSILGGQVVTIMGPSGCGKSTLLSAITGNLAPVFSLTGEIFLNDLRLNSLAIEARRVGILFQDDLLFPHLNVFGNLAFGLPQGTGREQSKHLICSALQSAGLDGFDQRDVATLSGGQKARISLLRCLLSKPQALLLDEPFSKLDRGLRQSFRDFVFGQIIEMNIPALLVTHDPEDCAAGVQLNLDNGRIESC